MQLIINAQSFTVRKWCEKNITLMDDMTKDNYVIPIEEFHNFFVVSYYVTTHKSQCQTYDFKYAIHEVERMSNKMKL